MFLRQMLLMYLFVCDFVCRASVSQSKKSVQIDGRSFQLITADDVSEGSDSEVTLYTSAYALCAYFYFSHIFSQRDNEDEASVVQPRGALAGDILIKTDALLRDKDLMLDRQQDEIHSLQQKLDQLERVVAGGAPQALVVEHLMRENAQLKHALNQHKAAAAASDSPLRSTTSSDVQLATKQAQRLTELQAQVQELLDANTRYRDALTQSQASSKPQGVIGGVLSLGPYMLGTVLMLLFALIIIAFKGD